MCKIVKWWQYKNVGGHKAQCEMKERNEGNNKLEVLVTDCETRKLISEKKYMLNVDYII